MHDNETAERLGASEKQNLIRNFDDDAGHALAYGTEDSSTSENDDDGTSPQDDAIGSTQELAKLLEQESKVPWKRVFQLSGLFFTVIVLNLLTGSGNNLEWFPVDITCGSIPFFLLEKVTLVIIVLFAMFIRRQLIQETAKKIA